MNVDDGNIFFRHRSQLPRQGCGWTVLRETVPGMSRSRLQKLIAAGYVSSDDNIITDNDFKVHSGDSFAIMVPPPDEAERSGKY